MSAVISGGGFSFSADSSQGRWRWSVVASNVQGLGQLYQVDDILTPFGPYTQTMMPIPEDVVKCMNESIVSIRQQFSPLMSLVSPTPPNFNMSVTEGDCGASFGTLVVQNIGSFGSFMDVSATPSSTWLQVDPTSARGVGHNQTATFNISADPVNLLNANSPYFATVIFQDNRVPATQIVSNFVLTVNPRPVIVASPVSLVFTYYLANGSNSGSQQVQIENAGLMDSVLSVDFGKTGSAAWWTIAPLSIGPLASGAVDVVTIALDSTKVPKMSGTYQDTLVISSKNASNSPTTVQVTLVVQ